MKLVVEVPFLDAPHLHVPALPSLEFTTQPYRCARSLSVLKWLLHNRNPCLTSECPKPTIILRNDNELVIITRQLTSG